MKNAKKILLFALALVALTLVMSLSIFAEETTEEPVACEHTYDWKICGCPKCGELAKLDEGSTNVSSNLGYKIYFATTLDDLNKTEYDVIRLKNNLSLPNNSIFYLNNPNAIVDLGGNVLYRNGGYLRLRVTAAKAFVNGYVYKTNGGLQIMAVTSLEHMEDITLVGNGTKTNNITGLIMNTAGAYLGKMKNVTICAGVLENYNSNKFDFVNVGTNGIYNHGIELANGTIGSMENVKISAYGQAITCNAKIGTMTNCVFSADNIALNIVKLQSEMKFVNCEIRSKGLAIYIENAVDSTAEAPVTFDLGNSKIVTDGAVFDISSSISGKAMFEKLTTAVALVNGHLYASLTDAVNALKASTEEVTTFALIVDLTVDSTIVIDKRVNFSFGGASYDVPVYGTNQVTHKAVTGYTVTSNVDVIFNVVEGGNLTISGDGKLIGGENAVVENGGDVLIAAGTYVGFNPQPFVATTSCVVNNNGTYTITAEHDYDDDVGQDKTNYQVDGVCNNCGFVRGIYAVNNVYYMTLEEALAAAIASGKQIVLAADIVLDGEVVWDLTGATFNFNNLTVTGNLSIVGGNFTTDVTDYLADGYCNKYVDKKGYVVSVHNCVAGTPAADGSVTYTCAGCGETYVINNALINGEYYLGTDLVVFNNGVLSAMGGEYTYTYNVTTGMVDTNSAKINFQVIDGVIYYKGAEQLHQHVGDFTVAVPTAPTCDKAGYTTYICKFCNTVIETVAGEAATGHNYVESNRVDAKPGVAGSVTYTCTNGCGSSYSETIDALPEHKHTEVAYITQKPLPSNGHTAKVGKICSECNEVTVEPVEVVAGTSSDANFKINSATLALGEDISVLYDATHPINSSVDTMYMVFILNGVEEVVENYRAPVSGNRYTYTFSGMKAHYMGDNIEAYVYAIEDGNYVMKSHLTYSVKQYCVNTLKKSTTTETYKNVIYSVLNLGDCVQTEGDYKTDALVSDLVEAELNITVPGIAVDSIPSEYNVQALTGDRTQGYDWKSGALVLGSAIKLRIEFTADSLENLTLNFDVDGRNVQLTGEDAKIVSGNRYYVEFQVKVLEYDKAIECTFIKDGVQTGSVLTYSVYSYIVRQYQSTSKPEAEKTFIKAVYMYAEAVKADVNK